MYLLDTNACIRILNASSPTLVQRMRVHAPSEIRMCSVVKAELYYGARRGNRVAENLTLLTRFFAPFVSVPFNDPSAEQYGLLRAELDAAGTPIGPNDLMIAAIAKTHNLVLVTHNTGEFARVTGLAIEDWER